MQFQVESISYEIAKFFELYQHRLPVVVVVTQGFYGDIVDDTFDREQVMILTAVSRQSRVVARCELQGTSKMLSIPEEYSEKLCKIKSGKVSEEESLYKILRSNNLPLRVQFPADRVLTVGNKSINTKHIPPLNLTKRFDEMYLLGNTIIDGELCTDVIHVPLYLSQLRLSVVTGMKGQSIGKWRIYFENLVFKCSSIEYDQHFGNANIAEYDPSAFHSCSKISYLQPKTYSTIINLIEGGPPIKSRPYLYERPMDVYKKKAMRPLPALPEKSDKNGRFKRESPDAFSNVDDNMYITPKYQKELDFDNRLLSKPDYDIREQMKSSWTDMNNQHFARPRTPTLSSPESAIFKYKEESEFSEKMYRHSAQHLTDQQMESRPKYQNHIPRATLSPTVNISERNLTEAFRGNTSDRPTGTFESSQKRHTVNNVKDLSIDEVNEYLNILKLGHFGEKFRDNMIDGTLLIELTENMLHEVFGMNRVQALRLLKFAKEGYIPT